jgi:hypothetical protein
LWHADCFIKRQEIKNPKEVEEMKMFDCASIEGEFGARFFGVPVSAVSAILYDNRVLDSEG